jgi:hypothetical protein
MCCVHRMVGLCGVEYSGVGTGFPWSTFTGRLQPHTVGSCLLFPAMLVSTISLLRFSCPWYNHTRLVRHTHGSLVIMGNFNLVANAALDRSTLPSGAASNPDRSAEEANAVQVFTAFKTAGHPMLGGGCIPAGAPSGTGLNSQWAQL